MNSCELVSLVTATACTISSCSTKEEIVVLISVFNQLGDTLTTILAHEEACSKNLLNEKSCGEQICIKNTGSENPCIEKSCSDDVYFCI